VAIVGFEVSRALDFPRAKPHQRLLERDCGPKLRLNRLDIGCRCHRIAIAQVRDWLLACPVFPPHLPPNAEHSSGHAKGFMDVVNSPPSRYPAHRDRHASRGHSSGKTAFSGLVTSLRLICLYLERCSIWRRPVSSPAVSVLSRSLRSIDRPENATIAPYSLTGGLSEGLAS
jgi:hypothetical protein